MTNIDHKAIEAEAYAIYQAEGQPEGKALLHWIAAEERLTKKLTTGDEVRREEGEGGIADAN